MNLKNQPPIYIPARYCDEIEKLSKAALIDMVWDLATRCSGAINENDDITIMDEVRKTAKIVLFHRKDRGMTLKQRLQTMKRTNP